MKASWFMPASSVAAAVGVHPFKTSTELFEEMISEKRTPSDSAATAHGIENESRAFQVYKTLYNSSCREGKGQMFFCPSMPWLRGFTDGLVYNSQGKIEGVLEIKCR